VNQIYQVIPKKTVTNNVLKLSPLGPQMDEKMKPVTDILVIGEEFSSWPIPILVHI